MFRGTGRNRPTSQRGCSRFANCQEWSYVSVRSVEFVAIVLLTIHPALPAQGASPERSYDQPNVSALDVWLACQNKGKLASFCSDPSAGVAVPIPTPREVREARDTALLTSRHGQVAARVKALAPNASPATNPILWGVTDFVVSTGERQLQAWAVMKFANKICDSSANQEFAAFLPTSCSAFRAFQVDQFKPSMALVKAAIEEDALSLPASLLAATIHKPGSSHAFRDNDAALFTLQLAEFAAHAIRSQDVARAFLRSIATMPNSGNRELSCEYDPFAMALYEGTSLYATAFQPDSTYTLEQVPDNDASLYMTLALIVNSSHGLAWPNDGPCQHNLKLTGARLPNLTHVVAAAARLDKVIRSLLSIEQAKTGRASANDRAKAFMATLDKGFDVVRVAMSLAGSSATPSWLPHSVQGVQDITTRTLARDYAGASLLATAIVVRISFPDSAHVPRNVSRVLALANDVAAANGSPAVSKALADFVSNGDGYLRKRSRDVNFYYSVNAYLGALPGLERAGGSTRFFAGPYLPLGVEFGFRHSWPKLFLQLADLGALASWRVGHAGDSLQSAPVVGVSQVFSPGAYAVVPVPTAPFAVGLGVDLAPGLRQIKHSSEGTQRPNVHAWRFGVFVAVDVPLFP